MADFLAGIITMFFIGIVWFPESFGKDSRRIYDKFMVGWNRTLDKH